MINFMCQLGWAFPRWLSGKESACQCRRHRKHRFNPWVGKIPWRRKWQPTLVFLPGKPHGQRSLVGCRSCGCRVQRVGHDWMNEHACNFGWAIECLDSWSNIILCVSVGIFLNKFNVLISKAGCPPQCGRASSNHLKVWIEKTNPPWIIMTSPTDCFWTPSVPLPLLGLKPACPHCRSSLSFYNHLSQSLIINLFVYISTSYCFCFSNTRALIGLHSLIYKLSARGQVFGIMFGLMQRFNKWIINKRIFSMRELVRWGLIPVPVSVLYGK